MTTAHKIPLPPETKAGVRASSSVLCWKRACDMPKTLRITQGTFRTPTGIELSYSTVFPPESVSLRGIVHGINDHSQRYFHVFQELSELVFGVLTYDLRSHGKSQMDVPGLRAHVDSFQEFIDDTNAFWTFAKKHPYPKMHAEADIPLVIMGMSLGTLISLHTVLSLQHEIAGIVLVAPVVSVKMTWVLHVQSYFSTIFSALFPTARIV